MQNYAVIAFYLWCCYRNFQGITFSYQVIPKLLRIDFYTCTVSLFGRIKLIFMGGNSVRRAKCTRCEPQRVCASREQRHATAIAGSDAHSSGAKFAAGPRSAIVWTSRAGCRRHRSWRKITCTNDADAGCQATWVTLSIVSRWCRTCSGPCSHNGSRLVGVTLHKGGSK